MSLATSSRIIFRGGKMTQHETHEQQSTVIAQTMRSPEMDACIKLCLSCFQSCEQTILHCL